jgi:hypothetical protein
MVKMERSSNFFFSLTSWRSECVAEPLISLENKDEHIAAANRADAETSLFLDDEGLASRLAVQLQCVQQERGVSGSSLWSQ